MATNTSTGSLSELQCDKKKAMIACIPKLMGLALSLTHNKARADDLVQQTLLLALKNLDKFRTGTNMLAWLNVILRNQHYSGWRKVRREQVWDPSFDNSLFFSTGLDNNEAETVDDFKKLLLYLVCLPMQQMDALVATAYVGLSYDEAASALSCAVGTVKSRVNRARRSLATLMSDTKVQSVSLSKLKHATGAVPKTHPYYVIAQAYEELYRACDDVTLNGTTRPGEVTTTDLQQAAWEELVASGALDSEEDELSYLLQGE